MTPAPMSNCCFAYSIRNNSRSARRQARRTKVQRMMTGRAADGVSCARKAATVMRIAISLRTTSLLNYRGFQIETLLGDER